MLRQFKRKNIVNSSFCDDLTLKDMSCEIKSSCIGRRVKIGRGVKIINAIIMNGVTIGDDVRIQNSVVCGGCKIGNGQVVKDDKLGFKTTLPDLKGDRESESSKGRRPSVLQME